MQKTINGYILMMDWINRVLQVFLAAAISIMTIAVFWQVLSRYIIGSPTSWSEELARMLMIYVVLLGSAVALRKGQMLSVDLIYEVVSEKVSRYIGVIVNALSIVFYVVLAVYGLMLADRVSGQSLQGIGLSMYWFYFALPLGGVFLTLNSIANILEIVRGERQ